MSPKLFSVVAAALVLGCGSSTSLDLPEYKQWTQQLSAAVAVHRDAGSNVSTPTECTAEHANYDTNARPLVQQMLSMSGQMDSCMMALGGTVDAGFHSTGNSMLSELAYHAQMACQSSNMSQDWAETERHCDTMDSFVQQELSGEGTMTNMMGGMTNSSTCSR